MTNRLLLALLPALWLVACGGDSGQDDPEAKWGQSPTSVCNGKYLCGYGSQQEEMDMHRDSEGVCRAGETEVSADGIVGSGDSRWLMTGTTARFSVCPANTTDPSLCIHCVDPDAPPAPSPPSSSSHGGKCTGSPTSCSSGYAGNCPSSRGCSFDLHFDYDGSSKFVCEGDAYSCDKMTYEDECERQGCRWE